MSAQSARRLRILVSGTAAPIRRLFATLASCRWPRNSGSRPSKQTAHSRLLGWHADDCRTGAAARGLAAQADFASKGDNRWQARARDSVCWPYAVAACKEHVVIADSGNNRVLWWRLAR